MLLVPLFRGGICALVSHYFRSSHANARDPHPKKGINDYQPASVPTGPQCQNRNSYFRHPFINQKGLRMTEIKSGPSRAITDYTASLANAHTVPNASPEPSATPRRDQYLARLTPLPERLAKELAKFPPDMLADGLHMNQLWPMVLGVQRSKPRAFEVAEALRALKWQRVRYYRDSAPSLTLWFPPTINPTDAKNALKARTRA